jgi:hypothetical protein
VASDVEMEARQKAALLYLLKNGKLGIFAVVRNERVDWSQNRTEHRKETKQKQQRTDEIARRSSRGNEGNRERKISDQAMPRSVIKEIPFSDKELLESSIVYLRRTCIVATSTDSSQPPRSQRGLGKRPLCGSGPMARMREWGICKT